MTSQVRIVVGFAAGLELANKTSLVELSKPFLEGERLVLQSTYCEQLSSLDRMWRSFHQNAEQYEISVLQGISEFPKQIHGLNLTVQRNGLPAESSMEIVRASIFSSPWFVELRQFQHQLTPSEQHRVPFLEFRFPR